ncbi:MAG TPA: hypothetical protein VGP47_03805 [Parachlamydiaceae bacterium]|nr:hypothetical protein [Parachlamydiaceae bacterium]
MLKLLLLNMFCVLSCTLRADQLPDIHEYEQNRPCHLWENTTPLTEEDLLTDLLLTSHIHPQVSQWTQKKLQSSEKTYTGYVRTSYVSQEIWDQVSPYFFPEHFPEKAVLDEIFSKRRVLKSVNSMYKSGFNLIQKSRTKIIVGRHLNLKGYIIKAFLDESTAPDWHCFLKRIIGVRAIQAKIDQYGYQAIMKAPNKWIYPLPPENFPAKDIPYRKNFILIAEEMDLLNHKQNLKAYKTKMTPQILDAYYTLLTELKLIDSVYADNTTFCTDGRLAFVDTEHSLNTEIPVPLPTVAQYLSPEMIAYWQHLYFNGGPQR